LISSLEMNINFARAAGIVVNDPSKEIFEKLGT
jgi:hypothetical protein